MHQQKEIRNGLETFPHVRCTINNHFVFMMVWQCICHHQLIDWSIDCQPGRSETVRFKPHNSKSETFLLQQVHREDLKNKVIFVKLLGNFRTFSCILILRSQQDIFLFVFFVCKFYQNLLTDSYFYRLIRDIRSVYWLKIDEPYTARYNFDATIMVVTIYMLQNSFFEKLEEKLTYLTWNT